MTEILRVSVDRDRTITNGVIAGKYSHVHPEINDDNFFGLGSGRSDVEIFLLHFGKRMNLKEFLHEFPEQEFAIADLQELLAIGEQFPDLQRKFPIHAPVPLVYETSWWLGMGFWLIPFISCVRGARWISLDWIEFGWTKETRFAAVRRKQKPSIEILAS